ncbi:MAG: uracil-DNA glycosylase [archaeon]|nr:uracil-DNA glycosylase [archaeon]
MIQPGRDCNLCGLCKGRTNLVLPSGDLSSPVVLVGEAPGETEDLQGMPFVGRAGKILNQAMEDVGLDRSKVMITNTVKCRPPDNRDPEKEEMDACRRFLESELLGRSVVVGLGKSAIKDLLGYTGPMAPVVNTRQYIEVQGTRVLFIPTYHPMACVYQKVARAELRNTLRMIKEEFGL